jgi:hypothetical protein
MISLNKIIILKMNILQLEFGLEHLMKRLRDKMDGSEDKSKYLNFLYRYSVYFHGNRNYFTELEDKQTTLFGLFVQLKWDMIQNLRGNNLPANQPVINLTQVQEWIDALNLLLQ